jgi:hypothetical protein
MDDRRFDSLVKTLTTGDPRRAILHTLGVGALAAVAARIGLADDTEAKKRKKKKKCNGNTTKCGKKACCRTDQTCIGGKCVDDVDDPECLSDDDCDAGFVCENGACVIDVNPFCQGNEDCASGEECFAGVCVIVAGTCDATDDHCSVNEALCNPAAGKDCFCLQRFGGGAACTEEFVPGAVCGGCNSDAACEGLEAASVCVKATAFGCPCDPDLGICARLCPNQ